MTTASFTLSIMATVHDDDAPLEEVLSYFKEAEIKPWRHFDKTIAFVRLSLAFDNAAKSNIAGIVSFEIGYHHEADMIADEEALDAFCQACPDCDIEITSAVLLAAYNSEQNLLANAP